jgi:hypothetical protein
MLFPRIPSRPVRYAIIATHAFRDAIADVEVDFTRAEQAIADRLDALTTKVDALMDRLAAYEEDTIDGEQSIPAGSKKAGTRQGKAKGKAKATGRRTRAKK